MHGVLLFLLEKAVGSKADITCHWLRTCIAWGPYISLGQALNEADRVAKIAQLQKGPSVTGEKAVPPI